MFGCGRVRPGEELRLVVVSASVSRIQAVATPSKPLARALTFPPQPAASGRARSAVKRGSRAASSARISGVRSVQPSSMTRRAGALLLGEEGRRALGQVCLLVAHRQQDGRRGELGEGAGERRGLAGGRAPHAARGRARPPPALRRRRPPVACEAQPAAGRRAASRAATSALVGKRRGLLPREQQLAVEGNFEDAAAALIRVGCRPNCASMSAARPAARGVVSVHAIFDGVVGIEVWSRNRPLGRRTAGAEGAE